MKKYFHSTRTFCLRVILLLVCCAQSNVLITWSQSWLTSSSSRVGVAYTSPSSSWNNNNTKDRLWTSTCTDQIVMGQSKHHHINTTIYHPVAIYMVVQNQQSSIASFRDIEKLIPCHGEGIVLAPSYTDEDVIQMINREEFKIETHIRLVHDAKKINKRSEKKIYTFSQAAHLLAHLEVIQQAYLADHDSVLILEEMNLLSLPTVFKQIFLSSSNASSMIYWHHLIESAPLDWTCLQWHTDQPIVNAQQLKDPWISWQIDHTSTKAYLINRQGMQNILNNLFSNNGTRWTLRGEAMLKADNVIYFNAKNAYTSPYTTKMWLPSNDGDVKNLTLQSRYEMSHNTAFESSMPTSIVRSERVLVLIKIHSIETMSALKGELQRIHSDYQSICKIHQSRCDWVVIVTLPDATLDFISSFQQIVSEHQGFDNVTFHFKRKEKRFDGFGIDKNMLQEALNEYDLVLFKDANFRLSGFPWNSFLIKRGNASVAGPLHQKRTVRSESSFFPFYEANEWKIPGVTSWSTECLTYLKPIEIPYLEPSLLLMNATFASSFFLSKIFERSEDGHLYLLSDQNLDFTLCGTAKRWYPWVSSCVLIPVVVGDENVNEVGADLERTFNQDNSTETLSMIASQNWINLAFGKSLQKIEAHCPRNDNEDVFTLENCMSKMFNGRLDSIEYDNSKVLFKNLPESLLQHESFLRHKGEISSFSKKRRFWFTLKEFAAIILSDNYAFLHIYKNGGTTVEAQTGKSQVSLDYATFYRWFTVVRDPIDHFLSGFAEVGNREYLKRKATGKKPLITKSLKHPYDSRVMSYLKSVKSLAMAKSLSRSNLKFHSFPQVNFMLDRRGQIYPNLQIVGALPDLKSLVQILGEFEFEDGIQSGRNASENGFLQEYFPRRIDWLKNETLRQLCDFLAIDYFVLDFSLPPACEDMPSHGYSEW